MGITKYSYNAKYLELPFCMQPYKDNYVHRDHWTGGTQSCGLKI